MSATVARPSTARFPGRKTGMAIVALGLAAALGFGIANSDETPVVTEVTNSQEDAADRIIKNRAAELAAQRKHLLNGATKGAGPGVVAETQPNVQAQQTPTFEDQTGPR